VIDASGAPGPEGPLAGRRIAVTRAREQSALLVEALERLGAGVIAAPALALVEPPSWAPLDDALARIAEFDRIVLTSANTLPRLLARLAALGLDAALLTRLPARFVAVGPATARGLAAMGIAPEVVPGEFRAEGIVDLLAREPLEGMRILIPRALEGRDVLPDALAARGAEVVVAPVYASRPSPEGVAPARAALLAGELDAVTFTSGAIAQAFAEAIGDARPRLAEVIRASIGPVTSQALAGLGLAPQLEAREATIPALVAIVVEHYAGPIAQEEAAP
jgi:uroporphyrinogen III methyltransferase/synthase